MLQAAQSRLQPYRDRVRLVRADFHGLPFRDRSCHLGVAAFCLYHSREPASVIAEIARCLSPHGTAILVTKSVNSYHELDRLVAATGLDHEAHERPSLYETAHSTNLPVLAASSLDVVEVLHDEHVFRFDGHAHLAEYLSTVPKYRLSAPLRHDPQALAAELRRRTADRPVTTTSTVTYVVARRTPIA